MSSTGLLLEKKLILMVSFGASHEERATGGSVLTTRLSLKAKGMSAGALNQKGPASVEPARC
jgi:hypothetical protein